MSENRDFTSRRHGVYDESRCERCGGHNPVWSVDSDRYNMAVNRSETICPSCFIKAHEAATGMGTVWQLLPMVPFRWLEDEGRVTPFLTELTKERE